VGWSASTGVPQIEQNRAPSGSGAPHDRQAAANAAPHEAQNLASCAFGAPHEVQFFTIESLGAWAGLAECRHLDSGRGHVPELR
jgi:hypothetical protein